MKMPSLLWSLPVSFLLMSCMGEEEPSVAPQPLRPVRTLEVMPTVKKASREFPAVVDAARSADLSFRIGGAVTEMPVKEGDKVAEGDVIARLDEADARIELKSARASFETALSNYKRGKKLVGPGHISRSDFDKLKSNYANAEAQLAAAKQQLEYTALKASFDGRIAKRHVENHEEIAPQERIVTLQDLSSLTIQIQVPESIMLRSRRDSGEHDFFVQFEAIAERRFPLKLKEASISADEENQTYEVTFTMPKVQDYTILPGMSALVIAETASGGEDTNSRFHLPAAAILEDREGRFVYLVKADSGKDGPTEGVGVIERRPVTTGELDARGLLVTSGLERGEHVLTAGMSQAQPGMKVRWNQGG